MRLAVIAPHPDDEAIACGGTIISWAGQAYCVYMKHSITRKKEAIASCKILGAEPIFLKNERELKTVLKNIEPDLVLSPHCEDEHRDHERTSKLVRKVWKGKLWEYETWNTIKNPDTATWFGEKVMQKKMKAVKAHKSQCKRKDWPNAIKSFNFWRAVVMPSLLYGHGKKSKQPAKYCEAFKVFKCV